MRIRKGSRGQRRPCARPHVVRPRPGGWHHRERSAANLLEGIFGPRHRSSLSSERYVTGSVDGTEPNNHSDAAATDHDQGEAGRGAPAGHRGCGHPPAPLGTIGRRGAAALAAPICSCAAEELPFLQLRFTLREGGVGGGDRKIWGVLSSRQGPPAGPTFDTPPPWAQDHSEAGVSSPRPDRWTRRPRGAYW